MVCGAARVLLGALAGVGKLGPGWSSIRNESRFTYATSPVLRFEVQFNTPADLDFFFFLTSRILRATS